MKSSALSVRLAIAAILCLGAPLALRAQASKPGWGVDQAKALEKAKTDSKLVVLDFTGSDWCPWCIKLDKEVFGTPEFKQYAKDHLELVEVDFPEQKYISPYQKKQNEALQTKFAVKGYPTVIVLNSKGDKVGELGYQEGGAKAFIAELEKLPKS